MGNSVIYNSDLHFEHLQWKKELLFWYDEIKSFQMRLEEIFLKWTDSMVLAELGQFRNNFEIHKNKINKYLLAIDDHENEIAHHYKLNENVIDRIHLKYHEAFRDKIKVQRELYNELKYKYYNFLSKYM